MNKKHKVLLSLLILTIFYVLFQIIVDVITIKHRTTLISDEGIFDCRDLTFDNRKIYSLDGKWCHLDDDDGNKNDTYVIFPDALSDIDNNIHTYEATLYLPMTDTIYSLNIPDIYDSYELSVDGKTLFSCGYFDPKGNRAVHSRNHSFYAQGDKTTVRIRVTNTNGYDETQRHSIHLGLPGAIEYNDIMDLFADYIIAFVCITCAIYYFILYIYNKTKKYYKSFSVFCLVYGLKALMANVNIIPLFMPGMPFQIYARVDIMLTIFIIYMAMAFSCSLANNKYTLLLSKISSCLFAIALVLVYTLSLTQYKYFVLFILVLMTISLSIANANCIIMVKNKVSYSIPTLLGYLFLTSIFIVDAFNTRYKFLHHYYSHAAFVVLLTIQVACFVSENAKTYNMERAISKSFSQTMHQIKTEEFNYLSSRLKPHFLFNSLNIILGYAIDEPERSKAVTDSLLVYLRQLFEHDNLNELNDLSNEIALLKAFAHIELERFPDLNIEYEIDDNIDNLKVPSLILQPLLENAINDGIRKKNSRGEGNIMIVIKNCDTHVLFIISDNGAGASKEVFDKAFLPAEDGKFHSINNIQYRLKLLYNEKLTIISDPEVGTTVSFKIPYNLS